MLSARLILVRHGQSAYNADGLLQGQADPPLSEAGRREARALAAALPRFENVLTSDLRRATETAALLGYPDATARPALARDRRRRLGRPPADRVPVRHRAGLARRPARRARRRDLGRPRRARRRRRRRARAATWLIVCHGGVVRAALSHVTGADPRRVAGPANASVTVISGGSLAVYGWTVGSVS